MTAKPEAKGLRMRGLDKTYNTLSGEEVEALKPVDIDIAPGPDLTHS